ncbi:hypothetical protein K0U83_26475, partial [bacterium]|nr:hypothetical protein [bacterium]
MAGDLLGCAQKSFWVVWPKIVLDYPQLESRLETIIPDTLDLLKSAQNEDGGWGWWEGSASDVEISSFILFGLT